MNGHIVDNVACGGCHTLLTATKGSNADFTNNDFNIVNETTRQIVLAELPPLKVPVMNKIEEPYTTEDVINSNAEAQHNTEPDHLNGNTNEETGSIDSLEANVSGSHIVNINDLETENGSTHDVADINKDEIDRPSRMSHIEPMDVIESMDTVIDTAYENIQNTAKEVTAETKNKIDDTVKNVTDAAKDKVEVVEEFVKKSVPLSPGKHEEAKKILSVPSQVDDIANSPPPKTPILPELLHIPDLSQISPVLSKHSDEKSETGQSENETIPCGSDKSSPQGDKTAKTQAVMPIVRSDDHIDMQVDAEHREDSDVVVNKLQEKGRFARLFQSIRDKENSCMGKGKVIEENIVGT
ncbi:hypothetical protein O3G_MSEX015489 [Manduca sexta]|uniref:Uncharacterized protein n=1 Tax=Manduca sexta TaxID=7130 RepID=A0A922A195_MANSE|nr:hypothetical protein O3G_MSEX015489 [Manduca sexta]